MIRPIEQRFSRLAELELKLGCDWPAIREATVETERELADLQRLLLPGVGETIAEDASLVFFGSLARGEFSAHSDLDWVLLVDGEVLDRHLVALQTIRGRLRAAKKIEPSRLGMFGDLVLNRELACSIAGQDDTRKKLSHRMLFLLESVSIGEDKPRQRTVRSVLEAYLTMDLSQGATHYESSSRSLLGDVVRFGQTMAVDLAGSFSDQEGGNWGLRNAKRRFSRKLILLTGMLACFNSRLRRARAPAAVDERADPESIEYLESYFARPPLEILADELLLTNAPNAVCLEVFWAYDQFLGMLADSESRNELNNTSRELADNSAIFRFVREISQVFQDAILKWFFESNNFLGEVFEEYAKGSGEQLCRFRSELNPCADCSGAS